MPKQKTAIDWRMAAGFGGLLFLIVAIGLIGILQIRGLSRIVSALAKTYMPMQNAVLEMKSSNSQYAIGIRSYMFWRNAKYLEAAAVGEKLDQLRATAANFDKHLAFYASLAVSGQQKEWGKAVRLSQAELRQIGEKVIALTDQAEAALPAQKKELGDTINRNLMDFESKLFRLDAFLDDPLQKFNIAMIDAQLAAAQRNRRRSVALLLWSVFIGLGLGAETLHLIYRRNKREKEHRELLWRRVIRVEEEERNNLSLQIHDQMGQDLSALKIYLGLIERDLQPSSNAGLETAEKIEKAKKILDNLMDKSHNISEMLRPPELEDLGLIESIEGLINQHKEMTGNDCKYLKPEGAMDVSAEHSLVLYRVVQEALTNIAKYSGAKNIEVSLEKRDNDVVLSVCDDGAGFDYNAYLKQPARRKEDKIKLGLQGLRERIELLGGRLSIDTNPGRGTRLEIVLPVA